MSAVTIRHLRFSQGVATAETPAACATTYLYGEDGALPVSFSAGRQQHGNRRRYAQDAYKQYSFLQYQTVFGLHRDGEPLGCSAL